MTDHIAEIKHRLLISDVVRDYIANLRPAGSGNYKAVCPFHDDRKPSLVISNAKGLAWCFACSTGGDHFGFVQKIENVSFPEALRILAHKANVTLPQVTPQQAAKQQEVAERKHTQQTTLEAANDYYRSQLGDTVAIAELDQRAYSQELIDRFQIGYAPDSPELQELLHARGHGSQQLLESGILRPGDRSGSYRLTFRNRLMFPIWGQRGELVGYSGRYLGQSDKAPKYLNSPETDLFHKSRILYGLHLALPAIRRERNVIIVEGFFDVMAAHAVGIEHVVATCGTALTEDHIRLLQRQTQHVTLAFDEDNAGFAAALRAAELCLKAGLTLQLVTLPSGKDLDELYRSDPVALREALETPQSGVEHLMRRAASSIDIQDLSARQQLLRQFTPLLQSVADDLLIFDAYSTELARILGLAQDQLVSTLRANQTQSSAEHRKHTIKSPRLEPGYTLLALALQDTQSLERLLSDARVATVFGSSLQPLYQHLSDQRDTILQWIEDSDTPLPEEAWVTLLRTLSLYGEERYLGLGETISHQEFDKAYQRAMRAALQHRLEALTNQLRSSDDQQLLEEAVGLQKQLRSLI